MNKRDPNRFYCTSFDGVEGVHSTGWVARVGLLDNLLCWRVFFGGVCIQFFLQFKAYTADFAYYFQTVGFIEVSMILSFFPKGHGTYTTSKHRDFLIMNYFHMVSKFVTWIFLLVANRTIKTMGFGVSCQLFIVGKDLETFTTNVLPIMSLFMFLKFYKSIETFSTPTT